MAEQRWSGAAAPGGKFEGKNNPRLSRSCEMVFDNLQLLWYTFRQTDSWQLSYCPLLGCQRTILTDCVLHSEEASVRKQEAT